LETEHLNAERELKSVLDGRLFHGFTIRSQKKVYKMISIFTFICNHQNECFFDQNSSQNTCHRYYFIGTQSTYEKQQIRLFYCNLIRFGSRG